MKLTAHLRLVLGLRKSETAYLLHSSACKIQTPVNYPEENIQHTEHGKSVKSRIKETCFLLAGVQYINQNMQTHYQAGFWLQARTWPDGIQNSRPR